MTSKQCKPESSSFVDDLLPIEEARIVYKNFLKFGFDEKDETSISVLIQLDAFITDAIDSLSQASEEAQEFLNYDGRATVPGSDTVSVGDRK